MSSPLRPPVEFTAGHEISATMAAADRPTDRSTRTALAVSLMLHAAFVALVAGHPHALDRARISEVWGGDTLELDGFSDFVGGHAASARSDAPRASDESPAVSLATAHAMASGPAPVPGTEHAHRAARSRSAAPSVAGDARGAANGDAGVGGRTIGSQDADPSARDLARAFTRAIPFGTRSDPIWRTLPLGPVGSMTVVFDLGDDGHIVGAEPKERVVAPALRALLERTLILLRMGRFAPDLERAGHEVLRVEARLDRAAADSTYTDSDEAMSLDYEPPTRTRPGRAAFQLGNGRRLEVRVAIVADGSGD